MNSKFRFLLIAVVITLSCHDAKALIENQFWALPNVRLCQPDSVPPNPFQKFIGEWVLKDNIFESSTNGEYTADVNPRRTFIAQTVATDFSILWNEDFDGLKAEIFWTYDIETNTVYHLSNTSTNGLASGKGLLRENGDLDINLIYPDACSTCLRVYSFRWKSENEFSFKATFLKDDIPTGDYYGAIFLRK